MSSSAREEILGRVRLALADVPPADETPIPWTYGQPRALDDVLDRFEDRIIDYRAAFERCSGAEVPARVAAALARYCARSAVLPDGLDDAIGAALVASGVAVRSDRPPLTRTELDATGAVVTTCAVAAAETGTIMLDHGPGQGRRALSLVPDVHVCIVRADQVVSDIPEAVARTVRALRERRPVTWISGGSATSDIELTRVEGVHGPRTLHVLLVETEGRG
ncbi:MAG: lactate utilization protein C [Micropruina sp.]|nr:lactate utilization protein C [Micropruina sp.]